MRLVKFLNFHIFSKKTKFKMFLKVSLTKSAVIVRYM